MSQVIGKACYLSKEILKDSVCLGGKSHIYSFPASDQNPSLDVFFSHTHLQPVGTSIYLFSPFGYLLITCLPPSITEKKKSQWLGSPGKSHQTEGSTITRAGLPHLFLLATTQKRPLNYTSPKNSRGKELDVCSKGVRERQNLSSLPSVSGNSPEDWTPSHIALRIPCSVHKLPHPTPDHFKENRTNRYTFSNQREYSQWGFKMAPNNLKKTTTDKIKILGLLSTRGNQWPEMDPRKGWEMKAVCPWFPSFVLSVDGVGVGSKERRWRVGGSPDAFSPWYRQQVSWQSVTRKAIWAGLHCGANFRTLNTKMATATFKELPQQRLFKLNWPISQ